MVKLAAALSVAVVALAGTALAQSSRPDPLLTPGAVSPAVTQANIGATICVRGWTRSVRPPLEYTEGLKRRQIQEYGYLDGRLRDYEEDHLVPLDLGGAPNDPKNLWPEPRELEDGWGADRKDELEAALARLMCAGELPLREAQRAITSDWIAAYTRYVGGR